MRHTLNVGHGDLLHGIVQSVEQRPVTGSDEFIDVAGNAKRAIELEGRVGRVFGGGCLQFGLGHAVFLQAFDLLQNDSFHLVMLGARGQRCKHDVHGRVVEDAHLALHTGGQVLVGDRLVHAAVLAVCQDGAHQSHRSKVRVGGSRYLVPHRDHTQLACAFDQSTASAVLHGLFGVDLWNGFGRARVDAKCLLHHLQGLGRLEITNDGDGGIVGPVIRVVKLAQLLYGHLFNIAAVSNGAVVVRVGHKGGLVDLFVQRLYGRVLAALKLVAHHGHLGLAVFFPQQQVAHAIGFHSHHRAQVLVAHVGIVIGAVQPGGGVVQGAGALQQLVYVVALGAGVVLGALEHQML